MKMSEQFFYQIYHQPENTPGFSIELMTFLTIIIMVNLREMNK